MRKKETLSVSILQMNLMNRMIKIGKVGNRISRRLQVIVLSGEGKSGYRIKKMIGMHSDCISRWIQRWRENFKALQELELSHEGGEVNIKEIEKQILDIVSDLPRSGVPPRITLAQKNQIIALACEHPNKYGIPFTHWNREMLTKVIKERSIVAEISARYVGKILRKKTPTA